MIIIALILIFITIIFIKIKTSNKDLVNAFNEGNVIVFGRKGKGKDLIFNYVIHKRKKPYRSNISFGLNGTVEPLNNLELGSNTYENFIEGNIHKQDYVEEYENVDFYISDGGVFLPSQYNTLLDKKYKSLPIFYALSRHLYNSNVHVNTQALNRVWIKLREQADTYIQAIGSKKILFWMITKYRIYDKYSSAEQELRPLNYGLLTNKYKKTKGEELQALNGNIKEGYIIQSIRKITYNTRHFKDVVFKQEKC